MENHRFFIINQSLIRQRLIKSEKGWVTNGFKKPDIASDVVI